MDDRWPQSLARREYCRLRKFSYVHISHIRTETTRRKTCTRYGRTCGPHLEGEVHANIILHESLLISYCPNIPFITDPLRDQRPLKRSKHDGIKRGVAQQIQSKATDCGQMQGSKECRCQLFLPGELLT